MKIHLNCPVCHKNFRIADKYLVNKEQITCPNCSASFPNEGINDLKIAIENLFLSHPNNKLIEKNVGNTPIMNVKLDDI